MNIKILVLLGLILVISPKHLKCSSCEDRDYDSSHYSLSNRENQYPSHYYDDNQDNGHYCGDYRNNDNHHQARSHQCGNYGNRDNQHYCGDSNNDNRHYCGESNNDNRHYCGENNNDNRHYCGDSNNENRHYCGENNDNRHYCGNYGNHDNQHQATGSQDLLQTLKADPTICQILNNPKATQADFEKVKGHIINTLKSNPQLQSKLADEMFGNGAIGALFNNQQRVKILNYVMDHPEIVRAGRSDAKSQVINFVKNDPELSSIYNSNNALFGN